MVTVFKIHKKVLRNSTFLVSLQSAYQNLIRNLHLSCLGWGYETCFSLPCCTQTLVPSGIFDMDKIMAALAYQVDPQSVELDDYSMFRPRKKSNVLSSR